MPCLHRETFERRPATPLRVDAKTQDVGGAGGDVDRPGAVTALHELDFVARCRARITDRQPELGGIAGEYRSRAEDRGAEIRAALDRAAVRELQPVRDDAAEHGLDVLGMYAAVAVHECPGLRGA